MSKKNYLNFVFGLGIISLGLITFFSGWLFLGVYGGREFGDKYLFLKHRPTFKFFFTAPLGESDGPLENLKPENRQEELLYQEFMEKKGGRQRSIPLPL